MNTTEILNKSLAWLHTKERSTTDTSQELSKLLLVTNTYRSCQMGVSELSEEQAHLYSFGYNVKYTLNRNTEAGGIAQIAPQELYILAQVILHTLNTEPERFHDMSELPGLESRNWYQLGQIARYLLKQGWIEVKAIRIGFLIKLTIDGKIHVGNHDAWA
jgi:hypothetical protein